MVKRILLFVALLHGGVVTAADTQRNAQGLRLEQGEQRYVYPDPEIPTLQDVAPQGARSSVEVQFEQRLWNLLAAGKLEKLRQLIAQRQAKISGWQPPAWLKVELARAELNARADAARNEPEQLLALFAEHPEIFTCREYYNLWSLADAYRATGDEAQGNEIHRQMLGGCRESKTLLVTLDRVAEREGSTQALSAATLLQQRKALTSENEALAQRLYSWRVSLAATLREQGNREETTHLLNEVEERANEQRDQEVGRLIAWNYRESGNSEMAWRWFERVAQWSGREEDQLNLLQMRWERGEHDAVIAWLRSHPLKEQPSRQWAAGMLRSEASLRYDAKDYEGTLTLLDQAAELDAPEPVDSTILRGWALYQQEQYHAAQQLFAEAYHRAHQQGGEGESNAANGLLYSTQASGEWQALLLVAGNEGGTLLGEKGERELAEQLASGSFKKEHVEIKSGHLHADDRFTTPLARLFSPLEGVPGFTWGSIRDDGHGNTSVSYLVNQGIDWVKLPGDITLNTFVEYRSIENEWRYLNDQTEGVVGIDLKRSPFHLGAEYIPYRWRLEENGNSAGRLYFSWYEEWSLPHSNKDGASSGWRGVIGYSGSTYGRINYHPGGPTTTLGYINQGIDWFAWDNGVTFSTYASYRFRSRNRDNYWYDAHGPALGAEFKKSTFKLGMDYVWEMSPQRATTEKIFGIYFVWYYGWDLKPR